jgi:NAD(P)-dependent dehydrogenase (short-subunit alcohol dehydrogenase family)
LADRRAALITGGARRIGRALALAAADAGYDIVIHCRASEAEADQLAQEIAARGRRAAVVNADLASTAEVQSLVPEASAALGPITLLVNNASIFQDDRIGGLDADQWDAQMAVNLKAPVLLAQAFAAQLPEGEEGLIVNLLDQRVLKPDPRFFSYGLSKAALWTATRTLAQALAPRIRVNGIGPGPTLPSIHQTPESFAAEAAAVPLQRRATPEAIAQALRYLIAAPLVTGQMIAVDGGQHLAWRTPDILDA